MRYAFFGQEDYILGLSNAAKSKIIIENTFDYFDENKPQVVIASESGFTRLLWKNLAKHKPKFVLVSDNPSAGKIEQLRLKNVATIVLPTSEVVAFDNIRYSQPYNILEKKDSCFICNSNNLIEYYYKYVPKDTFIYSKNPIYHPQYRGWLNDNQLVNVILNSDKVYDYCESSSYTHLSYTIVGCLGNIVTNKNKPMNKKLKSYKDSLREINEKVSVFS